MVGRQHPSILGRQRPNSVSLSFTSQSSVATVAQEELGLSSVKACDPCSSSLLARAALAVAPAVAAPQSDAGAGAMGRRPKSNIGACGVYVVVNLADDHPRLLVHRRSKNVTESCTIASAGGIVEKAMCVPPGSRQGWVDFERGALKTALRELVEEAGVELDHIALKDLKLLPASSESGWGEAKHRNYCAVLSAFPVVSGPSGQGKDVVLNNGLEGLGVPSGDGYSAWVSIKELQTRTDVMRNCKTPLAYMMKSWGTPVSETPGAAALAEAVAAAEGRAKEESCEHLGV